MRRLTGLLSLLMVIVLLAAPALAEPAASPIRDGAAVLQPTTLADARTLADRVWAATGLRLAVDVRHFLGGADAAAYAQRLLSQQDNSQDTVLLLAVVGEETYAVASGTGAERILGRDARDTLLSRHFRPAFQARDYDAAVADFLLGTARQLQASTGAEIELDGLFGRTQAQPQPQPNAWAPASPAPTGAAHKKIVLPNLNDILGDPISPTRDPARAREQAERQDRGLSWGSIIVIGFVLSAVFGSKKDRRGCGCGPLGWILGVFGLSKFFGWRR